MQEPAGIPALSARGSIAAVAISLLPFVAIGFNTLVLNRAREEAGPPPLSAIPALPDDVEILSEETGCGAGNWVRCYRVVIVRGDATGGDPLVERLGDWYRDRGQDLYQWRQGWRNPDCSAETGLCLAIDPVSVDQARIEISRMSDGL